MKQRLVLGTRGSRLALTQAHAVEAALRAQHPALEVVVEVISTEGDRVTSGPLDSWGRGVFVRDIERALLDGRIDVAVHSLKDVPADLPPGLVIAAVPERAPAHDVLLTRDGAGVDGLPPGARVGTSSLRRSAFLRAYRPDLVALPIRGNVDTRRSKLLAAGSEYDALVLAAAGLERLGLAEGEYVPVPFEILLPAPGQGALGLEARGGDGETRALVTAVHHASSAAAVRAERQVLRDLEGGCRLPVAALGRVESDGSLALAAAVASPDGREVIRHADRGSVADPESLGAAVAAALRRLGASDLLKAATAVEAAV